MRNRYGTEIISGSPVTIKPNEKYLPKLTCSCCGKEFLYNGIQDFASDPVCSECKRAMKGGPHDGKTVGDLY